MHGTRPVLFQSAVALGFRDPGGVFMAWRYQWDHPTAERGCKPVPICSRRHSHKHWGLPSAGPMRVGRKCEDVFMLVLGCGQRMQGSVRLPNASEARQIARRNLRNTWVIPRWRGGRQNALRVWLR